MAEISLGGGAAFVVVGANPRSSSLSTRDRLLVEDAELPQLLGRLRSFGLEQAVVLATCDRTDVYAVAADVDAAQRSIISTLAERAQLSADRLAPHLYRFSGERALTHLFTVAASLDSVVVGEPNILGQMKSGLRSARAAGLSGKALETLFQATFAAAKRVRAETAIGTRPVSIGAAAVDVARTVHGPLDRCTGLLLGSGELGELIARSLCDGALRNLFVADPHALRAEQTARTLGCNRLEYEQIDAWLYEADILVCALGNRLCAITEPMVREALRRRRRRPMFIIDAAIPGDVDPAVDRLSAAFVYDLDDLERIAREGHSSREREADVAARLIAEEIAAFLKSLAARDAAPAVIALRRHFERERQAALADAAGDAEKATRLLINRLLHGPSEALRAIAASAEPAELEAVQRNLERLFRLGLPGSDPDTENDE